MFIGIQLWSSSYADLRIDLILFNIPVWSHPTRLQGYFDLRNQACIVNLRLILQDEQYLHKKSNNWASINFFTVFPKVRYYDNLATPVLSRTSNWCKLNVILKYFMFSILTHLFKKLLRNWVFAPNSNVLILIYLQPDGVHVWYFKLRLFDPTELLVWNI